MKKVYDLFIESVNYVKSDIHNDLKSNVKALIYCITALLLCIIVALLIKAALPLLIPLSAIGILIWCNHSETNAIPTVEPEAYIVRHLLCDVLASHSDVLNIIKPNNEEEITPTQYPVIQKINNLGFYRFIVRYNPEQVTDGCDLENIRSSLYLFIHQKLQEGYPNIEQAIYNNMPYYTVFKVGFDYSHSGYLHIDIMPLSNNDHYKFVYNFINKQIPSNNNVLQPTDEEF